MKKKLTPDKFPYFAATCQAVLYVHAFVTYLGLGWGLAIGLPLGIVVSFSIAYGSSQINDVAARRRRLAWVGLVVLMAISPIVVAPALYTAMAPSVMATFPIGRIILCAIAALAPDGAILLSGAIAGRGMFGAVAHDAAQKSQGATQSHPTARRHRTGATRCEICTMQYHSKGAHYRQHHPDLVKKKVYAVQVQED